ncbi:MAG TPA: VOC family protein [Actinomycetota bacterium]|jgi:catechol 2,3-dioxygenase-like lactoylglutathione lyase family enzyme|nr:VOC family protein [Actinomycetota bacterium]
MAFEGVSTIGQIHVSVSDIDRSVAFYRDVLGARFLFQVPGQPMAFFDLGGVRLYLGKPESPDFRSSPILYFTVDDVDEAHRALRQRGVEFLDEPHVVNRTESSELWMAFFRDPDGTNLALMEDRSTA